MPFFKRNIFFLALFLPAFLLAQNRRLDSLRNRLKTEGQDTNRVSTLYILSNSIVARDPKEALKLSDEATALADKLNYARGLAYTMLTKGDALKALGRKEEAIKMYELGIERGKAIAYYKIQALLYNRLAACNTADGKLTEAITLYKLGTKIDSISKQYEYGSEAYRSIGEIYTSMGEHALAMENFLKAIDMAELTPGAAGKVQLGNAYVSMGNGQEYQKDYDKALESFKKSLVAMTDAGDVYGIAGANISIGNIYFFKRDYENALKYYQVCLDLSKQVKNEMIAAKAKEDIANVLLEQKKYNEALTYYKEGLGTLEKIGDLDGVSGSYNNMGNAYLALGNYKESENCFMKALEISKKYGLNNWMHDSYAGMAHLYFTTEKYKEAYLYKDSAMVIDSVIVGQEHAAQSKEMEARFQNRKKEDEIKHLNEVNAEKDEIEHKQKQIIIAVSAGLVLVLLLAFFLVRLSSARRKANLRLEEQNKIIAEKNKDITDSITYARRIQQSVLPDVKLLEDSVNDYFILNKPRDIVSGDFYWIAKKDDRLYVAVADCTGHGVPGALVSVVGLNMLNKIVEQSSKLLPAEVLEKLHELVINALNKDRAARETNDGMDIALLCIDKKANRVYFSGAARPLYMYGKNGFQVIRGDRYSIAGEKKIGETPFAQTEIPADGKMSFYLSSDGYADQFGESTGKKFLAKRFQDLLASIHELPMEEQRKKIEMAFEGWKGKLEQVDDVLVVGIQIV
jgi:serine phosphatase RsbU (regulator of sigma subunit)/tetratricopeptide (TPR) repeat protein